MERKASSETRCFSYKDTRTFIWISRHWGTVSSPQCFQIATPSSRIAVEYIELMVRLVKSFVVALSATKQLKVSILFSSLFHVLPWLATTTDFDSKKMIRNIVVRGLVRNIRRFILKTVIQIPPYPNLSSRIITNIEGAEGI